MKTKILFILLAVAIATSLYLTYDRAVVRKDFEVYKEETFEASADEMPTDEAPVDEETL
ncbi:MAG: hypothetical protein UY97_C0004G0018 [Parcubacteria group bacterium GW2011_GWB1_57_6]|nr:MAG: hypothetical protein UY93_C0002G0453 [Parcubacteria group bacterium GW2011_GWA1_56_13]KKW46629.1 MAG: hypothetical protein UY97_C0004G0018 [Parcubacteria group bacterium GW2011_GWB1_57_6]